MFELKKLFIIKKKDNHYKFIYNQYLNTKKNYPNSTKLIFHNELSKKDLTKTDILISNFFNNLVSNYYNKNNIVFFLIYPTNKKIKTKYDYLIDPLYEKYSLKKKSLLPKDKLITNTNHINSNLFNVIKLLNWDSNFWNIPSSIISSPYLTIKILKKINLFIKKNKVVFCSYLCDPYSTQSISLAEKNDFLLMDVKNTYEYIIKKNSLKTNNNYDIFLAKNTDKKSLLNMSENIFTNSRYYYDKNFPKHKVNRFYKDWIIKAINGKFDDYCVILKKKHSKQILAFVTIKESKNNICDIGLIAIKKEYQNKGLGSELIQRLIKFLRKKNIKKIRVVTQCRNIASQRLYIKNNFIISSTEIWYHKWINNN